MERTNHGRGLALTMGLASMYVCVLLKFVERWYAVIDDFQCVCSVGICSKTICWNWWFQCVNKRLYAEIDGLVVCILLEFIERLYAGIDGFNVCVLLELSDSLCAGVVTTYVVCVHAKMCVGQWICDSLPKLSLLQWISIRCQIVCYAAKLWFAAKTVSSAAN
jgi:hypothetical protein